MPGKQEQENFIKGILSLVKKATGSKGDSVILSCDPTHPVHNSIPGYLWQEKGKGNTQTLRANTGRRRPTVVGAINLSDRNIVPLVTESNADRYLMEAFFLEVKKAYSSAKEIVIILDNAAYQRNYEVQEYAKSLGTPALKEEARHVPKGTTCDEGRGIPYAVHIKLPMHRKTFPEVPGRFSNCRSSHRTVTTRRCVFRSHDHGGDARSPNLR